VYFAYFVVGSGGFMARFGFDGQLQSASQHHHADGARQIEERKSVKPVNRAPLLPCEEAATQTAGQPKRRVVL
jgi:hypothetical protein